MRQGASTARLFLVGPRGSGKTTLARPLAERLSWQWTDADTALEAQCGRSVAELFAARGEAGFRDAEAALLKALCGLQRQVIACGGGAVLRASNRALLRDSGVVIHLTADAETLWRRVCDDPATPARRPALAGGGVAEVVELLRVREPLYVECADLTIATGGRSPEEVVGEILSRLGAVDLERSPA